MRTITAFIFCLIIMSLVKTTNAELHIGGYYKNFLTTFDTPLQNEPLMGAVVNRLRINLSYTPTDTLTLDFAYDFTPRVQDPSRFSDSPFAVGVVSSRYRISDFASQIYPKENDTIGNVGIYHNLDRAAIQYSTNFADISIGRDAIAWGSARFINPTDVVAPYSYDQLDTEDRVGVDAVRVRIPIGVLGEVDTGYIFGTNFNLDKSAIYLRTQLNAVETDFSILLIQFQKNLLFGLETTRGIGGAGFWLETAYVFADAFEDTHNTSNNYLRSSVGLDYSFNGETLTFIEYHFNSAGTQKPQDYIANLTQPAYMRGGVYLLGVHYLAPGFIQQITL